MYIKNILLFSKKNAITPVVGVFLVIVVVMSVTGGVLYWGVPYIEQNRAHTQIESVYSQLNVYDSALQDLIHEGPGASRENKVSIESGAITVYEDSDRIVCMYSLKPGYNFTVSDIDNKDRDFTLHMIKGTATKVKVFWLGLSDPQLDIIADEDVSIRSVDNCYVSYLKFDISKIPSDAIIDSAYIILYIADPGKNWDNKVYVYNVENDWNDTSTVNVFSSLKIDSQPIYASSYLNLMYRSDDLSNLIYRAVNSGEKFCSFKIATERDIGKYVENMEAKSDYLILGDLDNNNYLKLYSCDSSKIGYKPSLIIYYHTPGDIVERSSPDKIFVDSENKDDYYRYMFGTSTYIAYFKEYANSNDTVKFSKNPYSITFQPAVSDSITGYQNFNKVIYPNAFGKEVDLEYICHNMFLKENIVIRDKKSLLNLHPFDFKFKLAYDTSNVSIFVDNKPWDTFAPITGKSIEFRDHSNKPIFRFAEPYAYDADNESIEISYNLFSENDTVYLQLSVPVAWLLDTDRSYPVVIDPTVVYTLEDVNSRAYRYDQGDLPPLDPSYLSSYTEFTSSEYTNACYNDSYYNVWEGSNGHGNQSGDIHPSGYYGNVYYRFRINQDVFSIKSINISWVGHDTLSNGGVFVIYIWNVSSSSWKELKRVTSSMSSDQNYTISVTSSIYNYIDSDGYLIVAVAGGKGPDNTVPNKPSTPSGETSGETGTSYTYSTSTTDPEGDDIKYGWDWNGDGTVDEWTGWYSSGETVAISHSWSSSGTYNVKVRAYDGDKYSAWSDALTVSISSANNPPYEPYNPSPSDGATGVSVYTDLNWRGGDPDGDPVTYDVYFGTDPTPDAGELVSSDQSTTSYDPPGTLSYSTTYYWKIVAKDSHGATTEGPIWSFTTESQETDTLRCVDTLRLCASSGDVKCALLLPNVVNSSNTFYNDIYTNGNNFYFGGPIFTSSFYGLPSLSTPLYDIRLKSGLDIFTGGKSCSFDIDYIGKEKDDKTKGEYTLDRINETHFTIYENYVAVAVSYTLNDTTPPTSRITDGPPAGGTITYNNVTFKWTAEDDITPTSELVYQYYLQGYDSSWKPGVNDWTSSTSVTYYNLPRGNYTFKVRAKDQAGNIEVDETSLNTRSFTIIAPTETFVFSPSIGPGGSGTATFTNNLGNFVLIELYNGKTLFGRIWIADLSSIKYSLSSSVGTYELSSENAAIIKYLSGGPSFVKNDPIVYSDSKSFALHIVQNLVSNPGGGGGSGVYRFSSRVLENSIREKDEVYVLKLQFYGNNKDAWYNYFIRYYGFKEDVAIIGFPYTIYYPIRDKINFILAHSIVKTTFGGIY